MFVYVHALALLPGTFLRSPVVLNPPRPAILRYQELCENKVRSPSHRSALFPSSGSYKDSEGLRHHDDFDVSLLVCHSAAPFEEQSEAERRMLR